MGVLAHALEYTRHSSSGDQLPTNQGALYIYIYICRILLEQKIFVCRVPNEQSKWGIRGLKLKTGEIAWANQ